MFLQRTRNMDFGKTLLDFMINGITFIYEMEHLFATK